MEDIHNKKIDQTNKNTTLFLRSTQEMDETNKNIVFVTSTENIDSAISLSQYIYTGSHKNIGRSILLTFIGELHKETFKCDEPSLSIDKYCRNSAERNKNCRVMLEYSSISDPRSWPDDPPSLIKKTFGSLKDLEIEKDRLSQIIPFDKRPNIIGPENQYDLYWRNWDLFILPPEQDVYKYITQTYISPFDTNKNLDRIQFINEYSRKNLKEYYNELTVHIEYIKKLIKQREVVNIIIEKLQIFWSEVTDFYLLEKIFTTSDKYINEYIVLMGEYHHYNVKNKLIDWVRNGKGTEKDAYYMLVNKINIDKDEKVCVNIYKTYTF